MSSQLAHRYATALYEVTEQKGNTQEVLETLVAFKTSLETNQDIFSVLTSPLMSDTEKLGVLKSCLGAGLNDELSTFFDLLVRNNRTAIISTVVDAFQEKMASEKGEVSGHVRSAVELSDSEKSEIKSVIEKELSKKVNLEFTIDPKMLGGVEAKVGSYIFENSIKTHMQKLNDFITRRVQ